MRCFPYIRISVDGNAIYFLKIGFHGEMCVIYIVFSYTVSQKYKDAWHYSEMLSRKIDSGVRSENAAVYHSLINGVY